MRDFYLWATILTAYTLGPVALALLVWARRRSRRLLRQIEADRARRWRRAA